MSERKFEFLADSSNVLEWLALRKTGIGGSDAPGAMLCTQYNTQAKIYIDKTTEIEDDAAEKENEYMVAGKRLEPFIAEWCIELMNADVQGVNLRGEAYGQLIRSLEYPWMIATPDWLIRTKTNKKKKWSDPVPFQIKNTMTFKDWDEGIPEAVLVQCLHEMIVFGTDHCYVGVLLTGNRPRWARIERKDHEATIDSIIDETGDLWEKIQQRVPIKALKIVGEDRPVLSLLHPKDNGQTIALPGHLMELAVDWDDFKTLERESKKKANGIAAQIQAEMEDNTYGTFPDGSGFSWKHQHKKAETKLRGASDSRVLRRQKSAKAANQ